MDTQVLEAKEADMHRIFEICSLAFDRNEPYFDATYPKHWTESGRHQGGERFTHTKNSDPHTTYLKAFDASTGEILGMAKWNIYDDHIPDFDKAHDEKEDYWDNDDEKAFSEALAKVFYDERNAAITRTGGKILCLDILAVDPEYQRKGVGAALVKWGADKADAMGYEAVVESSPFGKGLYLKHGFEFVNYVVLDPGDRFADREKQEFAWLVRPKKA